MRIETAPSCPVSIFIAGPPWEAADICQSFCDEVGLCVTVTRTEYVYTGGIEEGVIVGLINYPRFPSDLPRIEAKAIELAMRLKDDLGQESFSVQTPTTTTWFSWREADIALAAAARQGGDVQQAPAESPQSGPNGNAQRRSA